MEFSVLRVKHKTLFIVHQIVLITTLLMMYLIATVITNPNPVTNGEKTSVNAGLIIGGIILLSAIFNRIRSWLKVRFVAMAMLFIFALLFRSVIDTVIWTSGLMCIPMAFDDIIMKSIWNKVWYNEYVK